MIGVDSRFRGNDGLSRGLRPGFRRLKIAGRVWCVMRSEKVAEARGERPRPVRDAGPPPRTRSSGWSPGGSAPGSRSSWRDLASRTHGRGGDEACASGSPGRTGRRRHERILHAAEGILPGRIGVGGEEKAESARRGRSRPGGPGGRLRAVSPVLSSVGRGTGAGTSWAGRGRRVVQAARRPRGPEEVRALLPWFGPGRP